MIFTLLACLPMQLDRQVEACASLSSCSITIPAGTHVITKPWNLRDKKAVSIKATAGTQVIWHFESEAPTVCLDTSGTSNIVIDGVTFALGNASKKPDCLWVHSRGADNRSQEILSVSNSSFLGWYNKTAVLFVAVENEEFHSVDFNNAMPNTTSHYMSRENELGVISQFGPIRTGMTSTNHSYYNCSFGHDGQIDNDKGFGLTLGTGVFDLLISGGSTTGGNRGGVLSVSGQNNRRIAIIAPNWEAKNAKSTIVIDGYVYGLSVERGLLMAVNSAIQINGTAENLYLCPTEMLTKSIIQTGPSGRMLGGMVGAGIFRSE